MPCDPVAPATPAASCDPAPKLMLPESPMTVIAEDNDFRCGKGNGDGLWPIASLPTKPAYPFGFPTIAPPGWQGGARSGAMTQEDYNRSILAHHPEAASILPIAGVVIAGGAAAQPFNGTAGDVDFFLVGVEPGAIWKKVAEIELAIQEKFLGGLPASKLSFMKKIAHGVVTIVVRVIATRSNGWISRTCKIQVILRLFADTSRLLHGFDVGSCAIAFDGTTAYTTLLGAYSLSHRVNIVCPLRRSTSYESRLGKYFVRGYALVVPHLDTGALAPGETLSLPFLRVRVDSVHGPLVFGNLLMLEGAAHVSDYEEAEDDGLRLSWDRWGTNLANSWRLAQGSQSFVIRSSTERNSRGLLETNDTAPLAGFDGAEPSFQDVLPRTEFVEIVYRVARSVVRNNRVKITTLRRFFGLSREQVVKFVIAAAEATESAGGPHGSRILIDMLPALRPFCEALFDRYDEVAAKDGGRLEWVIAEDPSRQYTATLNPRIVDPQVWYGDAYVARAAASTDADIVKALRGLLEGQGGCAAGVYAGCAICFDDRLVSGAPNSVTFGCGHVFHWSLDLNGCEGVRTWALGHSTCPTCRRSFAVTNAPAAPRPTHTVPVTIAW